MTVALALTLVGFPCGATVKAPIKKNSRTAKASNGSRNPVTVQGFIQSAKNSERAENSKQRLAQIPAYKELKVKYLTPEDLAFGEKQIVAMLRDRPAMAKFVKKGDSIWNWTVHQFAGEGLGTRIHWVGAPPNDEFLGQTTADNKSCEIRVLDILRGEPLPGEMQWSVAVFELHNARAGSAFDAIGADALDGKLTRKDYIRRMTAQEFDNMHQQQAFFKSLWLPHCRLNHLAPTPYYWKIYEPNNYKEWIAQYGKGSNYPENYGRYFDNDIIPFVRSKEQNDAIASAIAQVRSGRTIADLDRMAASMDSGSGALDRGDAVSARNNVATNPPAPNPSDALLVLNKGIVEVQKTREIESIEKQGRDLYLSGKFKEAAPFYEQAAEIRQQDVGSAHQDYATALTNLALIYSCLKRYDDAERLYKQALDIRENSDPDRSEVKITLRHLIALYHAQGKTAEIASLQKRIKMIEDMEELDATDDDGVSTDKVEWMKAPVD